MREQNFNLDIPVNYQVASLKEAKDALNDFLNAFANALIHDRLRDTVIELKTYLKMREQIKLPQFNTLEDYLQVCEQLKSKTIEVYVQSKPDSLSDIIGRILLVYIDEDDVNGEILTLAEALNLAAKKIDRKITNRIISNCEHDSTLL